VTELSGDEMVVLFKQHVKVLREGRDAIWEHITASRHTNEQSRALIVQIDEQISQMERELGLGSDQCLRKQPSSASKN
jgi:hypothetical protein